VIQIANNTNTAQPAKTIIAISPELTKSNSVARIGFAAGWRFVQSVRGELVCIVSKWDQ
jgi:hypothetical protein